MLEVERTQKADNGSGKAWAQAGLWVWETTN